MDNEIEIRRFADMICKALVPREFRRRTVMNRLSGSLDGSLMRIKGRDGNIARPPTAKETSRGRSVGSSYQLNCFICRKYLAIDGSSVYQLTPFCCSRCNMPLCNADRRDAGNNRNLTCLAEHLAHDDDTLGCFRRFTPSKAMPPHMQKAHTGITRRRTRNSN